MTCSTTRRLSLLLTLVATVATAQTRPTAEDLEKMLEPLRPTAEHQDLARLAGRFTQEITYEMGGPPMKATGTVTNRLILGGRFLVSESTSKNPSGFGGEHIESMMIFGFDRRTSEYTVVAYDTMGTYYVTAAGKKKEPAGVVFMSGETLEREGGTSETRKYDMVLTPVDADTYRFEIIFKFPGRPDQTVVSTTHRRVK